MSVRNVWKELIIKRFNRRRYIVQIHLSNKGEPKYIWWQGLWRWHITTGNKSDNASYSMWSHSANFPDSGVMRFWKLRLGKWCLHCLHQHKFTYYKLIISCSLNLKVSIKTVIMFISCFYNIFCNHRAYHILDIRR